jgi:hypothetical protein
MNFKNKNPFYYIYPWYIKDYAYYKICFRNPHGKKVYYYYRQSEFTIEQLIKVRDDLLSAYNFD